MNIVSRSPRRRRDGCSECKRKKVRSSAVSNALSVPGAPAFPKQCKYESKIHPHQEHSRQETSPPQIPAPRIPETGPQHRFDAVGNPAVQQQQALPQPLTPLPSPLLSSRTARFLLHHFGTQTAPVLFPLAPPAFGRRRRPAPCSRSRTARTAMTAMALCTNDVCDGGDARQWRVHLAGVKALLDTFAEEERRKRGAGVVDPFAEYLAKWFAAMDTVARVSGLGERGIGSLKEGTGRCGK
ncbi:hypothetical protein GTA08_BOTSDO14209 [Botryosphaeria dothidea]|uniref:Uncharacterized protein n=1 Tax=Botryosphaeria dothidea TaxID=55169 RepID=A0A8H4IPG3_9PEZI|nr:hypothetical protein GTA08_BOTSDO14209 [Botryosphaeria dothidea]